MLALCCYFTGVFSGFFGQGTDDGVTEVATFTTLYPQPGAANDPQKLGQHSPPPSPPPSPTRGEGQMVPVRTVGRARMRRTSNPIPRAGTGAGGAAGGTGVQRLGQQDDDDDDDNDDEEYRHRMGLGDDEWGN